jgi:hypothetical protein
MANQSLNAAFKRMWQHTTNAISNKADKSEIPTTAEEVGAISYNAQNLTEAWTPDVASSLFAKVLVPNENEIPKWEQPDSTNAYKIGDKVSHNGKTWESNCDNNVWEPGVYGWTEI